MRVVKPLLCLSEGGCGSADEAATGEVMVASVHKPSRGTLGNMAARQCHSDPGG